jgi:hypothetical protein
MECPGLFPAAMDAHHPFDEHLAEIISDQRQLRLKKHCRERVSAGRTHTQEHKIQQWAPVDVSGTSRD